MRDRKADISELTRNICLVYANASDKLIAEELEFAINDLDESIVQYRILAKLILKSKKLI
jgi:hypothetical protein